MGASGIRQGKAKETQQEAEIFARENFPQGMSLEEINEEIRKTRYGVEDGE